MKETGANIIPVPENSLSADGLSSMKPHFNFDKHKIGVDEIQDEAKKMLSSCETPGSDYEVTGEELLNMSISKIDFLVDTLIQKYGLASLAGSSETGKSSLARQLAIAIVAGEREFLGMILNQRYHNAIYVTTEDMPEETAFFLKRQTNDQALHLFSGLRFIFDIDNLVGKLDYLLSAKPADIVIIDCFLDIFDGDLKETQKIRKCLHQYQDLTQRHKCLILFVHHTGKRTENSEPNKNNLLSGQGFEAKMRLVLDLSVDPKDASKSFLTIVKGNYLSRSRKSESIELQFDENTLTFKATGSVRPVKHRNKNPEEPKKRELYLQAVKLRAEKCNYDEIAAELGYASRGTISKLFTEGKEKGWDINNNGTVSKKVSNGNLGNNLET